MLTTVNTDTPVSRRYNMPKVSLPCPTCPGEYVRRVILLEGSRPRLLCPECVFKEPELLHGAKDRVITIEEYLDRVGREIEAAKSSRDYLKENVPEQINEFFSSEERINSMYEQFVDVEFTKLKNIILMTVDKIREVSDAMIAAYKKRFDDGLSQFKKNSNYFRDEAYAKYHIISDLKDLDTARFIRKVEEANNPSDYIYSITTMNRPELQDKDNVDAYCLLLLNKFMRAIEEPPSFEIDKNLEAKINAFSTGAEAAIRDIANYIDQFCIKNIEVGDLQSSASISPLRKTVSADGYSAFMDFDMDKKLSLRLANKILSATRAPLTCIANVDNDIIVAGDRDGRVAAYNIQDGEFLGILETLKERVSCLNTAKDRTLGTMVFSASTELGGPIVVSGLKPLKRIGELKGGHSGSVTAMCSYSEGRSLFSGGSDGVICVWDLLNQNEPLMARVPAHRVQISCIKYDPFSQTILTGSKDGHICQWRIILHEDANGKFAKGLEPVKRIERPYPIANIILRQATGGSQLISVCQGGTSLEIIDLTNMIVEDRLESSNPTESFIVIEHLLRDGRKDFSILNTNLPGELNQDFDLPEVVNQADSGLLRHILTSIQQASGDPGNPKVQLVQHNKKSIRLAKITSPNTGATCINFYDIVTLG